MSRTSLFRSVRCRAGGDERWQARRSSQWVSSHPTHRVELNAAEFGETFTTYMGCDSRLVRPYTGRSIPCGARRHMVCDAYGHQVGLAALPGAPFTDCHDAIAHELWRILMEAGVHVDVEPRGIFTTLIPTQVLLQPGSTPGAVPDAAIDVAMAAPATARNATAGSRLPMQRWLFDVKTIFGGNGLYQCPRARDEQSGAVAERAHRCAGEYLSAARAADRQYSAPGTNPILDRLRSFGQTRGLAFGAYGEASPDVHALLTSSRWQPTGWRRGSGATWGRARRRRRARSSSPRCAGGWASSSAASSHATASAGCRTSACRGPSSSGACSAASSSEDRRRECRSTCRTPTSSSTRPARDGWPAARKARTDAARAARRARSAGPVETELHGLLSHGSC